MKAFSLVEFPSGKVYVPIHSPFPSPSVSFWSKHIGSGIFISLSCTFTFATEAVTAVVCNNAGVKVGIIVGDGNGLGIEVGFGGCVLVAGIAFAVGDKVVLFTGLVGVVEGKNISVQADKNTNEMMMTRKCGASWCEE